MVIAKQSKIVNKNKSLNSAIAGYGIGRTDVDINDVFVLTR